MKIIDELIKKCEDSELNIYTVLRRANLPKDTVYNWRKKDPKPFETKSKIEDTITKMIHEKENNPTD